MFNEYQVDFHINDLFSNQSSSESIIRNFIILLSPEDNRINHFLLNILGLYNQSSNTKLIHIPSFVSGQKNSYADKISKIMASELHYYEHIDNLSDELLSVVNTIYIAGKGCEEFVKNKLFIKLMDFDMGSVVKINMSDKSINLYVEPYPKKQSKTMIPVWFSFDELF